MGVCVLVVYEWVLDVVEGLWSLDQCREYGHVRACYRTPCRDYSLWVRREGCIPPWSPEIAEGSGNVHGLILGLLERSL